jgi:hypothetical protein
LKMRGKPVCQHDPNIFEVELAHALGGFGVREPGSDLSHGDNRQRRFRMFAVITRGFKNPVPPQYPERLRKLMGDNIQRQSRFADGLLCRNVKLAFASCELQRFQVPTCQMRRHVVRLPPGCPKSANIRPCLPAGERYETVNISFPRFATR